MNLLGASLRALNPARCFVARALLGDGRPAKALLAAWNSSPERLASSFMIAFGISLGVITLGIVLLRVMSSAVMLLGVIPHVVILLGIVPLGVKEVGVMSIFPKRLANSILVAFGLSSHSLSSVVGATPLSSDVRSSKVMQTGPSWGMRPTGR